MKNLRRSLKGWGRSLDKELRDQKEKLSENIDTFESIQEDRLLNDMEFNSLLSYKKELFHIYDLETKKWAQ